MDEFSYEPIVLLVRLSGKRLSLSNLIKRGKSPWVRGFQVSGLCMRSGYTNSNFNHIWTCFRVRNTWKSTNDAWKRTLAERVHTVLWVMRTNNTRRKEMRRWKVNFKTRKKSFWGLLPLWQLTKGSFHFFVAGSWLPTNTTYSLKKYVRTYLVFT